MITDRVGDFIVRLTNAAAAERENVTVPHSNHLEAIAKKLKELGYVDGVEVKGEVKKSLVVTLAHHDNGR
jgi:ribosomal protein S8